MDGANYYFDTLEAAVSAISENNEGAVTITLVKDTAESVLIGNRTLILELNGHNLSQGTKTYALGILSNSGSGHLTIQDSSTGSTGTVTGTDYAVLISNSADNSLTILGGKFVSSLASNNYGTIFVNNGTVNISGGTFINSSGGPAFKSNCTSVRITGGTFSSDVSGYCAAGCSVTKGDDNSYVVSSGLTEVDAAAAIGTQYYGSPTAAVNAAADGDTVTLLKDLNNSISIASGKNVILDLNGHTISINRSSGTPIHNSGTLVIKDTSAGQTGKVENMASTNGIAVYNATSRASVTITGGTFATNSATSNYGHNTVCAMYGSFTITTGIDVNGNTTVPKFTNTSGSVVIVSDSASLDIQAGHI